MLTLEGFSELLEVLYSTPLEDGEWNHFLALLSRRTNSAVSVFLGADNHFGVVCRAQGGTGPDQRVDALAYNERYVQTDPFRAPCLRDPTPRLVQGDDLLPDNALLSTELYRDLLAPQGLRYATLLLLTLTVRRVEIVTIWRTQEQGAMDEDTNALLGLLLPHLQKALEIRQLLGVMNQRLAGAEVIADSSSTATFLVTHRCHIVQRNAAAETLLHSGDVLKIEHQRLTAVHRDVRHVIEQAIGQTAATQLGSSKNSMQKAILLPHRGEGRPLQMLIIPLPAQQRGRTSADALVLVTDPARPAAFPDETLRALYNLTPAEVEVANGLLMGYSIDEIAGLRRVSTGTVRNQVKTILAKTSTARQSDLMRLLMSLPQTPAHPKSN